MYGVYFLKCCLELLCLLVINLKINIDRKWFLIGYQSICGERFTTAPLGIQEILACGIRELRALESVIQFMGSGNPLTIEIQVPPTRNSESTELNPDSKTVLDYLT